MNKIIFAFFIFISSYLYSECPEVLRHEFRVLDSQETQNLCEYKGKVILAVNVASRCGFTYQYESLQELYGNYQDANFVILGFPSRDFLYQEFKDESKVKEFCTTEYGVTFPMFATSKVKGKKANPFFKDLARKTGIQPGWNFHKYLIDRNGGVSSFNTKVEPDSKKLTNSIIELLN